MRIFSVIKRALVEFNLCFVPTSLVVDAGCLVYPFVTIFACIFQIETLTLSFICTYNHAWLFATVWENLLIYVIFWRSHSFFLFFFLFGLSFLALKRKSIVCCKTNSYTIQVHWRTTKNNKKKWRHKKKESYTTTYNLCKQFELCKFINIRIWQSPWPRALKKI